MIIMQEYLKRKAEENICPKLKIKNTNPFGKKSFTY